VLDLRCSVRLVADRPGRVGGTERALLVVGDAVGVPGGARGVEQRVRVGLADDRRVAGEAGDSLVGGRDAVLCGMRLVGQLGDELGGAGVVDGLVRGLFELAAGLVVGVPGGLVPLAGLPGCGERAK
jgi:hypothetical protein